MASEEIRRRRAASVRLIVIGFSMLLIGVLTSLIASYQLSPREKVVLSLEVPGEPRAEVSLPGDLSEKVYFNISYSGDRLVNATVTFYGKDENVVGGLRIEDAARNRSGFIYLSEPPSKAVIESHCGSCNTKLSVTLYFARYSRPFVYTLSILSTIISLSGALSLLTGGYAYVLYRREITRPQSSQAEREPQQ